MILNPAQPSDIAAIHRLLEASDLPGSDINEALLSRFIPASELDVVIGVLGLEIYGDVALLRSLAVASKIAGADWVHSYRRQSKARQ